MLRSTTSHGRRTPVLALAGLLGAALIAPAASAQTFDAIGTGIGKGLSSDGSHAYGNTHTQGAFIWDEVSGIALIGADNDAVGSNPDGTLVAGNGGAGSGQEAALWEGSVFGGLGTYMGASGCGNSLSSAYAMSDDGTVVGLAWNGCNASPFRWTLSGGMDQLPYLGSSGRANDISADGSTIGGHDVQSGTWLACIWDENNDQTILLETYSSIYGLSFDGTYAVGQAGDDPFIWSEVDGMRILPRPAGVSPSLDGIALAVSADGTTVVGVYGNVLGGAGFVWREGEGTELAEDWFPDQGIQFGDSINAVMDVTPDGRTFLLNLGDLIFGFQIVRAELEHENFQDVGNGLAGTNGEPDLTGVGDLLGNDPLTITLDNGLPLGNAYLCVGFAELNAPFKAGVMVPDISAPGFVIENLPLDGNGDLVLASTWPAGIPSGFSVYMQYWISDAGGPAGFAASNGLRATTP